MSSVAPTYLRTKGVLKNPPGVLKKWFLRSVFFCFLRITCDKDFSNFGGIVLTCFYFVECSALVNHAVELS